MTRIYYLRYRNKYDSVMLQQARIMTLSPGGTLLDEKGQPVTPPPGWAFLPSGDAGVTRKVTSAGPFWRVQVKMGKRNISKGVWAPAESIEQARKMMEAVRQDDSYRKKTESAKRRREKIQAEYVDDFEKKVIQFLHFHPRYEQEALKMARLICDHATPVGSGTVARTTRIPIDERASRAVIAWMRHQTTAYDQMQIARIKGERRRVRQTLAQKSVCLLEAYRKGDTLKQDCPLLRALNISK
ncbi:MAG: DUF2293 domain-containing protein [Bacteroidales bacterium]